MPDVLPPAEPSPRDALKALKVNEAKTYGARFTVKRKAANDFSLVDCQNKTRCRFGTLDEILGDLDYCLNNGGLPPPVGGRW